MSFSDEVYPNSPLAEVVCEIRFPGNLRVECSRHLFWEEIREEYPEILVPRPRQEVALVLEPYKFRRKDREFTVMVAINKFALSTSKYPGYELFIKEFLRLHSIFEKLYDVSSLKRVGWRYINLIPFVRDKGLIPLDSFLNLGFKVPESIPEKFNAVSMRFVAKTKGGSITTNLETLRKEAGDQEALLLDIDYGKDEKNLVFKNVAEYIDEAHIQTRQLFEDLIKDEYRTYLRGNVI